MSRPRKPKAPSGRDPLLRSAAEAKLARSSGTAPKPAKQAPPEIIHELQVHQVELEMQNEELKWARLALEQSRDRYLHLYDFAPVGYFTFTGGGQIVEVNLTGASLLGVPRARLIGRGLGSFVAAEDRDSWARHLASVLPSAPAQGPGEKHSCELKLTREDGSIFHARLESVRLDRPQEGKPAGAGGERLVIHTALSDITKRVRAEEAHRQSEQRFELAVRGSMDGIWDWNIVTHEDYFSDRWCELIGYQRSELKPHVDTWRNLLHPEDRDRVAKRLRRHLEQREPYEVDFRLRTKGGDYRWFRARGQAVWNERGQPTRMAGALTDITERTQAAQRLQAAHDRLLTVLESITDAFFSLDREWRFTYVNQEAERIFGEPRKTFVGHNIWEKFPPAVGSRFQREYERAVAESATVHFEEFYPPFGRWFEVRAYPSAAGLSVYFCDITERRQAEAALRTSEEQLRLVLEQSNDAIIWADAETGILVRCNRKAEEITERTRDELIGMHQSQLHPPDRDYAEVFRQATALPSAENIEAEVLGRTGKRTPVTINSSVVAFGRKKIIQGIFRDITERKRMEEALREGAEFARRVIESSQDCIKVLDLEGHLLSMSEGGRKLLEIEDLAPYLNQSWVDFWKGQDREAALKAIAQARKGDAGSFSGFCATAKGTPKWWEVIVSPIKDADGNITRLLAVSRDITARKQAEITWVTASEQRRLVLEAAGMGAWDYRFDTDEVFWDERCRNQWGIAQGEQIDYAAAIAAIHPDDRAAVDEAVKQALAGAYGGAYHREFRVVWPDGSVHWIGSHGQVYFEGEGERRRAVRFIGANREITDRRRMEEAQEFLSHCGYRTASEDFFQVLARYLAQSLGMDFVCVDRLAGHGLAAQTVAMYCDGKFEDNVSYALKDTPCGEVVGKTICCFPRDVRQLFPRDAVLQEMKAESYVGTTLWSHDGKPIGLIAVIGRQPLANPRLAESVLKLVAVRAAGELERAQAERALQQAHNELEALVQERTARLRQVVHRLRDEVRMRRGKERELSEAERRYRTVAEFTHDWEYWETPEGALRYCSPSCERVTGYAAGEFMADPTLMHRIVLPEDADLWQQHEQESLATSGPQTVQFRIRRKDGSVRWLEHACQPVLREDGVFLGIRANNRDITRRKEVEWETQRLREELAHMTRVTTAGQLAASLAHELNQPLTAILCNAQTAQQLLAPDPPNIAEVREALEDIAHDSERAGAVIRRLRALFNKTGHERSALQLNDIIQETLELLRSEVVLKGITTQVHLEPALPGVLGNRIELQQVVLNLVVNAMEAMSECEPGQRQLQIATGSENPREIHVSIRDAGPGIRVQPISRLFEPFFTTKANGLGMGLAISQSILEAHDGSLRAVNNPDRGATFHLTLPIHHGKPA